MQPECTCAQRGICTACILKLFGEPETRKPSLTDWLLADTHEHPGFSVKV